MRIQGIFKGENALWRSGKKKDINLSIANTILSQIEMAYNHTFRSTKNSFKLDAIWVITSGKITKNAEQVIYDRFSDKYLAKIIRFFDGEKICELIEQHAPEIFYSEYEKYFAYFSEINNMLDNISDLKTIGSTKEKKVSELYVSLKVCEDIIEKDRQLKNDDYKQSWIISSERLLESGKRSIVLGGPGAGKTTLLRHMALEIASKNLQSEIYQYFPIYAKLNEFIRIYMEKLSMIFQSTKVIGLIFGQNAKTNSILPLRMKRKK